METFTLKVIGFSRVFYEGEAVQAQLPIQDGSMGIMAHHEAAVIGIVPGRSTRSASAGRWRRRRKSCARSTACWSARTPR